MYYAKTTYFTLTTFSLAKPFSIYLHNLNRHVSDILGILMMYNMLRYHNPELRYHSFSRTTLYHVTIPVVYP